MIGRRSFFEGIKASTPFGILGMTLLETASPARASQNPQAAARRGQTFRELDKEEIAMNYPGEGIQKIAIPYRERRGKIKFPNDAQLAVHVYVALEYALQKPVRTAGAVVKWDISTLSASSEYNYHIASWRCLDMLEKVGIKSSALVNGWPAEKGWPRERYGAIYKEFHRLGHDVFVHNYQEDESNVLFSPEQEVQRMRNARRNLEDLLGTPVVGYITHGETDRTIGIQIDEGYLYNASLRDDDNPWIYKKGNRILVEIPHRTATTGDWNSMGHPNPQMFQNEWQRRPQDAVDYCKRYVDAYLATAQEQGWPLGLTFGIHPYVGCLPDRARILERMLTHIAAQPKVWVCTYKELAEYWKANYA